MRIARPRDVELADVLLGLLSAALVWAVALVAVAASRLTWQADVRQIDPGSEVAIAVQPVLDFSGGSRGQLPSRWRRKPAMSDSSPTRVDSADAKRKSKRKRRRRPRRRPALPSVAEGPDAVPVPNEIELPDLVDDSSTGAVSPPDDAGAVDDSTTTDAPPANDAGLLPGETGDGEGPAGEGDPVVAAYRARLIRWLAARFRVRGSGLDTAELLRFRVRATISLDDDATVTGFDTQPSGNPHFDEAAQRALESIQGEGIPPPPSGYPNALPRRLDVTFVCSKTSCD